MLNTSIQRRFIILIVFFCISTPLAKDSVEHFVIEDFSSYKPGLVPDDGWRSREGDPNQIYKIVHENEAQFLQANSKDNSVQLFREKGWDIKKYPILSWKWRGQVSPGSGKEFDSMAGVYVVFPNRWFIPESIKYVWSHTLPVGTVIRSRDRFPKLVIRSGMAEGEKGQWMVEERNVYEDFKTLFGRSPSNPVAFGVLTDSNDTHKEAAADYDDFIAYQEMKKVDPKPKSKKTKKGKGSTPEPAAENPADQPSQ